METLGHVRALVLSRAWFYVGLTGSESTAKGGGSKSPYAGPVGHLTAAEMPEGGFGVVPQRGAEEVTFNPRTFPAMRSLLFCIGGDKPVTAAAEVVMRDWHLWANGPQMMSDADVDEHLAKIGLTRADVGKGGKVAAFMRRRVAHTPSFGSDPRYERIRPHLIRLAYQELDLRSVLLSLL